MKKLFNLLLVAAFICSCQSKSDSVPKNNSNPPAAPQATPKSTSETLNFTEIKGQDIEAVTDINMGSAESSPFSQSVLGEEVKMVKFSYFLQENKLVQSQNNEKTKGYCELSASGVENLNGAEVNLISGDKLFSFGSSYSEETKINNLNYEYRASFALTFQNTSKAAKTLRPQQFVLECFNIFDLADLKSTVDSKFKFTQKEEAQ